MFKVNNKNTRTTPWHRSVVFIINFEHISYLVLVFFFVNFERFSKEGVAFKPLRHSSGEETSCTIKKV